MFSICIKYCIYYLFFIFYLHLHINKKKKNNMIHNFFLIIHGIYILQFQKKNTYPHQAQPSLTMSCRLKRLDTKHR